MEQFVYIILILGLLSLIVASSFFAKRLAKKRQDYQEVQRKCAEEERKLQQYQDQRINLKELCDTYEKEAKQRIDTNLAAYEKKATELAKVAIQTAKEQAQSRADEETAQKIEQLNNQLLEAKENLGRVLQDLASNQDKQKSINEEIRRQREIEEKKDFYRVCLSEESLSDINILTETRKNLRKPEFLDKIIYDNYISKPVLEMIKRVLQNTTCSGIYKITCIPTGEVYIGKSTDVKNRWQQHCKTAFNCGTIASSLLHTKMKKYGIENFTFELLEKVSKDQLTEREKFYINFYQTKEVGLNERNG